jgi:hypothetical protein
MYDANAANRPFKPLLTTKLETLLIFGPLPFVVLLANAAVFLTCSMTVLIKLIIAPTVDKPSSENMPNALISSIDLLLIDY